MKKITGVIISILVLVLIISYFIPTRKLNETIITNTYTNVINTSFEPKNWIKWNPDVREAWNKDSSQCHFSRDSVNHISTIDIPGRQIKIEQENLLLYNLTDSGENHNSRFTFLLTMNVGDKKGTGGINTLMTYGHITRFVNKIIHYDNDTHFENQTVNSLKSYLESLTQFYGYPLEIGTSPDSIFLTKSFSSSKKDVFNKLPMVFKELDSFARAKGIVNPVNKNINFNALGRDSFSVNAGINIDKKIPDDYLISCKQFYIGQTMIIGQYEGPFYDRLGLYKAMDQVLFDHQMVKGGASYERYLSPLPVSDSSLIKIQVFLPLINRSAMTMPGY